MQKNWKKLLISVGAGLLVVIVAFSGLLQNLNYSISDAIYQQEKPLDRRIIILGIDNTALEYFGPIQTWTRDIYADALWLINGDEENMPAAVGLDVLFSGYTDEETDQYFVDTCSTFSNIVLASKALFRDEYVEGEKHEFKINPFYVDTYEEPFPELAFVTKQGFINNMLDQDAISRTGILRLALPDGEIKNSFSYEIYRMYAEKMGIEAEIENQISFMNSYYQWYIPFSSKPMSYEYYSFADLFFGDITGEDLKDCIVLIGAYEQGLQDGFFTAIDHATQMYGVEIHANLIDAMINEDFKAYVNDFWQIIVLGIIICLSTYLYLNCKIRYSVILTFLLTIGYVWLAKLLYGFGYIIQAVYLPMFSFCIFVITIGIHYVRTAIEKNKVVGTFKRYVAPQVVDEIFKTGTDALELGGKLTDIACLFVDIRGFTPMSELLEPTEVVAILNQYLNLTNACIMRHGGTLDKFIGDATMAIYNAPLPMEDYIYKAVETAWDMVASSAKLSKELQERFGRTVSFGIGVHCGKAVVGNIGTAMRMDYTAIGDTVNTAARLEANAKGGQILISRAVYDALEGRIKATSIGDSIKLKGKSEGFEILILEDVKIGTDE